MGGSSKKQTVGYKYYLGMHMILCHGPVDRLLRIRVDEKMAWQGDQQGSGSINVAAENLFGGESREGGVSGTVDFEVGGPTQGKNSYLASKVESNVPNFRGVVGAVLRQVYLGLNPYLKKWDFRISRVHVRQNGLAQWYDAKAEILRDTAVSQQLGPTTPGWRYLNVPRLDTADYSSPSFDDSSWSIGQMPFASAPGQPYAAANGFPAIMNTYWPLNTAMWIRKKFTVSSNSVLNMEIFIDNIADVWVNGVKLVNGADTTQSKVSFQIPSNVLVVGENVIVMRGTDDEQQGSGDYTYAAFKLVQSGLPQYDLNPAHIIRECLTDPDWGMGYAETDIDDTSFMAAADALFDEGMGISLLWDRQVPIEDFIKEIIKHIDAVLYIDRTTGKFVLRLIRGGYNAEDLLLLNEDNIIKLDGFQRTAFGELTNSVTVNYWDSETGNTASLTVQDIALAQMQGAVINTTVQYPGFTNSAIASRVAQRDLKSLSTPLITCTIYANQDAKDLNIGDVFRLAWEDYELDPIVMRVNSIAYGDGKKNQIKITAVQDVFALPSLAFIAQPPAPFDPSVSPVPVAQQIAFEVPYLELVQTLGQLDIDNILAADPVTGYIGAAGVRPLAGTLSARMLANAGSGYEEIGALEFAPGAQLVSAIGPAATTFDIEGGMDLDQVTLGTWLQCDSEIMAVTALSDTSITVKRGCLDTVPASHSAGAYLIFWDAYAQGSETQYASGETVKVKLLTVTGAGELPVAMAAESSVTMNSRAIRPYPPGAFRLNSAYFPQYIKGTLVVSWAHRDRKQQTGQNIVGHTDGSIGPETGTTYSLEMRGEDGALKKSYSAITATQTTWTSEAADGNLYTQGAAVTHEERFVTGIPASYGTQRSQGTLGTSEWDASVQALTLDNPNATQAYYELTSLPYLASFDFEVDIELTKDYSPDNKRHFGLWLAEVGGTPRGYRLSHFYTTVATWAMSRWTTEGNWGSQVSPGGSSNTGPSIAVGGRTRLRVVWDGSSGLLRLYVGGVLVLDLVDTNFKKLRPGIFFYHAQVRVHEVKLLGFQAEDRLNNQVNVRLWSVVNSRTSWQSHQHTTTRLGYGYSYGIYYGGI